MATVTQCDLCKKIETGRAKKLGLVDAGSYLLNPHVTEMCNTCSDYVIAQFQKSLQNAPTAGLIKKAAGG